MSASSKKKLRREQEAAKMTEKQLAAQKEAKKLNLYTIAFVVVLLVLLVTAIVVGIRQTIVTSGIREKNTIALTVGDHEVSNAELNYFFMETAQSYSSYASMFGLDLTKPLNEQVMDETTGLTWADSFLATSKDEVTAAYAVADAAAAAGYTLSEDEIKAIDDQIASLDVYAMMYGYADGEAFLKANYGYGATPENYREYLELRTLQNSYYNHYGQSLTYGESELRAMEEDNYNAYSSYDFNTYYLAVSRFEDEAAAEEAARSLTAEEIDSVEALDAAIAGLSINADTGAASTANNTVFTSINTTYADWVTDEARQAGDKAYFENTSTTTDDEGSETTTVSGYYVVYFNGSSNNETPLKNVRHILLSFEHDHDASEEHDHSTDDYTDEEKAAAKANAESIYQEWKDGGATEELFAELANNKSADSDGISGGLYEDVYPGQMVTNFNDWCFDDSRKPGDTDIIETEYGYHIMYFVGDSDLTYRDYLIQTELRNADLQEWYNGILDSVTPVDGDSKYVSMDLVMNAG